MNVQIKITSIKVPEGKLPQAMKELRVFQNKRVADLNKKANITNVYETEAGRKCPRLSNFRAHLEILGLKSITFTFAGGHRNLTAPISTISKSLTKMRECCGFLDMKDMKGISSTTVRNIDSGKFDGRVLSYLSYAKSLKVKELTLLVN